jgi:hypothetical protein
VVVENSHPCSGPPTGAITDETPGQANGRPDVSVCCHHLHHHFRYFGLRQCGRRGFFSEPVVVGSENRIYRSAILESTWCQVEFFISIHLRGVVVGVWTECRAD